MGRLGHLRRWTALGALLFVIGVSPANGFIGGVVVYQRDTAVFYYPLFAWASEQLQSGRFPLWTPEIMGGYPLFADSEIGLASPAVLLALLTLPPEAGFIALRLLHVAIAACGAYALARAWNLAQPAALIAGLTFALGSFVQAHLHHENIVRTAAFLPVVLACIERALRAQGPEQLRWVVAAALSLGFASLGLHPQILAADMLLLGAYALLRVWVGGGVKPIWLAAGASALGLAMAAVQLVPLVELAGLSARAGNAFPYTEVAGHSLTPYGLIQLVLPYFFRDAELRQWGLWTHWESYLYVGLVPLALVGAALARVRRREVALWVLIAVGGLVLALGQYLPLDAFAALRSLPGLGWLRAPGRFSIIVDLALAMLAAHGLVVLQARVARPSLRLAAGLLLLPVSLCAALLVARNWLLVEPEAARRLIDAYYLALPKDLRWANADQVHTAMLWATSWQNPRTTGAMVGLALVVAIFVAWQATPWPRVRGWRGWPSVLVVGAALDLLVFSWNIHPREALSSVATPHAAAEAVRQLVDNLDPQQRPVRVLASPVLNQVAADRLTPLGLHEAGGYSSLDPSRHREYFRHVRQVDDDLLDLWNVRYVLDPVQYGSLANYRGVQFLGVNALLRAAAHTDLGEETFHIPAGFGLAEVRLVSALIGASDVAQGQVVASLTLRTESGQVLAQRVLRAGQEIMDGDWDELAVSGSVRHGRVEVAGEVQEPQPNGPPIRRMASYAGVGFDAPPGARILEIRNQTPRGQLIIYGAALADANGQVQQLFARLNKSKYREVLRTDGIVVLENTAAFPRAFVVQNSRLATLGGSLQVMESRNFAPREEVVLAAETPPVATRQEIAGTPGRAALLRPGRARIERYEPQEVAVRVTTPQDSFLVLSDSFYPGWRAYVNGVEQPILRGNLMFRVVQLPEGNHDVIFRFQPMSVLLGLRISLAAAALALGLIVVSFWPVRHSRRAAA